jgi:hypothetical protein
LRRSRIVVRDCVHPLHILPHSLARRMP